MITDLQYLVIETMKQVIATNRLPSRELVAQSQGKPYLDDNG